MPSLIYYSPFLTAVISLASLCVSALAWHSIRQRATRTEMLAIERRLASLETAREAAPNWETFSEMKSELRDLHGHVERIAGEMQGMAHNTELILEHLLRAAQGAK